MEKVKERTSKYGVSVSLKNNGYYIARISLGSWGGRLEKSGITEEQALVNLLNHVIEKIDTNFNNSQITCKFDNRIPQRLVSSINEIGITTPVIMEKTLLIVNKINQINSYILNNISLQTNVIPFKKISSNVTNTTHISEIVQVAPSIDTNKEKSSNTEKIKIKDFVKEWVKYKFSLCEKTENNPKPLSKKTIDGYCRKLNDVILPYCEKNKKLYLSQLTEDFIKELLKITKGQTSKRHVYIILNMIFKYAMKTKNYEYNPMEKIDKPVQVTKTEEEKSSDFIEPDEQDKWLEIFEQENNEMSKLFFTMLLTGIRPEERLSV